MLQCFHNPAWHRLCAKETSSTNSSVLCHVYDCLHNLYKNISSLLKTTAGRANVGKCQTHVNRRNSKARMPKAQVMLIPDSPVNASFITCSICIILVWLLLYVLLMYGLIQLILLLFVHHCFPNIVYCH